MTKKIHKERKIAIISDKRKKIPKISFSHAILSPNNKKMKFNLTQTVENVQTHTSEL